MADDPLNGKTTAPTNEATLANLNKDAAQFTELELDFVTFVSEYYGRTGKIIDKETAEKDFGLDPNDFTRCITNPLVQQAFTDRGIELRRFVFPEGGDDSTNGWRTKGLTVQQLNAANFMLDLSDTRSDRKKLQDLGISNKIWQGWLSDPVFTGYLRDRAERMIGTSQHEAHLALLDRVRSGDVSAIKYYNELNGRFTSKADGPVGSANLSGFEFQQVIGDIIEIIVDEVDDPIVGARIADRLKLLGARRQLTNDVVNGPALPAPVEADAIVVPTVVPNRIMSKAESDDSVNQ